MALTDDDKNMVDYFWKEKGDIERWVSWEERKSEIAKECPALVKAWEDYKAAEAILNIVVDSL